MRVRVRGIYTTALTRLLGTANGEFTVVQPSPAIRERFGLDAPTRPYDVIVATSDDRQGVGLAGTPEGVAKLAERLETIGIDTLRWRADAPRGAVFAGLVAETLGRGAVVGLGPCEGFLPFSTTDARVETDDVIRVQVRESSPPWSDDRPVLDTDIVVGDGLLSLVREEGANAAKESSSGGARGGRGGGGPGAAASRLDVLATDPPAGWRVRWESAAEDATFAAMDDALDRLGERATEIDAALTKDTDAPHVVWEDRATVWMWFGRASRFTLDESRRAVVATMPGHHRIKAGDERASAAVDFAESVCAFDVATDDTNEFTPGDSAFPFAAVTDQFGPRESDTVAIQHGKPDGRSFSLGRGTVTERDDASVTVRREMRSGGTYDALGTDRQRGDVATTKFVEGRWWYATVYRGADGASRGTYCNICTPIEVFPEVVRYVDLHVDVIRRPDGTIERVDDDELDEAVDTENVSTPLADRARSVAARVADGL